MGSVTTDSASQTGDESVFGDDTAILVQNVTKKFRIYKDNVIGPLRDALMFWRKNPSDESTRYEEFIAIDDVSVTVRRGEVIGIIGPNGAGKTTLLQMIAGILEHDGGSIHVNGRLTTLLAHGVAVHPEFSGRENIYHNGLLLGMTTDEIGTKTKSIINFSELGAAIDRPFRTYSSGMKARLLFSIALSIDPEILIVDEALATGDTHFVNKCLRRIREIYQSGATILFVSHNMTQVQELCDRAIFLADGRIVYEGDPPSAISKYSDWTFDFEKNIYKENDKKEMRMVGGTGDIIIDKAIIKDKNGTETSGFFTGDPLYLEINYRSNLVSGTNVDIFLGIIRDTDGVWVGEIYSKFHVQNLSSGESQIPVLLKKKGKITITLEPLLLVNNHYSFWIMFSSLSNIYCEYRNVTPFFAGRRAYVIDRAPVYWQPCVFDVD